MKKLLWDFFPIALFFIVYKQFDIYTATATLMGACAIQVLSGWIINRKVETMHIVTLVLVIVLGSATLFLQDERFIKWKPSVVNWLFALVFFGSHFIGERPIIQRMMSGHIEMPDFVWFRLSMSWIAFFIISGIANVYVMFNFDTDTWVNFKLFGMLGMTLIFVILQTIFLSKYIKEDSENSDIEGI
ncbi:MAG: septation protein A [Gammaproteobacteria bacterium]|nr:septation protein A [Gammaproteobacteria bacterium]